MTTLCMALFFRYLAKLCVENKTFKTNNSVENQHVSTNHFSNILPLFVNYIRTTFF